jgi:hypothetical protein
MRNPEFGIGSGFGIRSAEALPRAALIAPAANAEGSPVPVRLARSNIGARAYSIPQEFRNPNSEI